MVVFQVKSYSVFNFKSISKVQKEISKYMQKFVRNKDSAES